MLIREDPPADPQNRGKYHEIAEKLRNDLGAWYKISEDSKTPQVATQISTGVLAAFRPKGDFEATSRKNADGTTYSVWARYVGEA